MLIPRVFWVALGAGAGVLAVNRAQRAMRAATPAGIADRAGVAAQGTGEQVSGWWSTVRRYAAEREAELRDGLGLDTDTPGSGKPPARSSAAPGRPSTRRAG